MIDALRDLDDAELRRRAARAWRSLYGVELAAASRTVAMPLIATPS